DVLTTIPSSRGVSSFNDAKNKYWSEENKYSSVQVPNTNTAISVLYESWNKLETLVLVSPGK
ncbi:hypothetical protein, partial [Kitasatospora nipponensis]